jgi:monofunctional biosynthetic peptidoglycan transglycosylase
VIALAIAVLAHAAGLGLLGSYLRLPDVRPLAEAFPHRTAYMGLRAAEAGAAWHPRYEPVPLEAISPALVRAVLVAEDATFYQHRGVDWYELWQAVRDALSGSGELRGASTLTQQLARNLYLSPSRRLSRKWVELLIARRLERELPKPRILELYLNVVEWGPGIFGAAPAWGEPGPTGRAAELAHGADPESAARPRLGARRADAGDRRTRAGRRSGGRRPHAPRHAPATARRQRGASRRHDRAATGGS